MFDHCLVLEREIRFIWCRKFCVASALHISLHALALSYFLLGIHTSYTTLSFHVSRSSPRHCHEAHKLNWDHQDVHITLRPSYVTPTHFVNRTYYGEIAMLASHMVLVIIVAGEHISQRVLIDVDARANDTAISALRVYVLNPSNLVTPLIVCALSLVLLASDIVSFPCAYSEGGHAHGIIQLDATDAERPSAPLVPSCCPLKLALRTSSTPRQHLMYVLTSSHPWRSV